METKEIQDWLAYWNAAKMVALDEIRAFEHVFQARKYCECMRINVFADVSDLAIWRALTDMRSGKSKSTDNWTDEQYALFTQWIKNRLDSIPPFPSRRRKTARQKEGSKNPVAVRLVALNASTR